MKCFSSIATVGTTLVALGTVMACGNGALAASINNRPINTIPVGNALQTVFDDITVNGPGIGVKADQKPFALFNNTSASGSGVTLVAELAAFANDNQLGIYTDPTNKALIFDGFNSPPDRVYIDFFADGTVKIGDQQIGTGFNKPFGFYITTPQNNTFFTEDSLNNGNPQALVYQGDNQTELQIGNFQSGTFTDDEFLFAFEDLAFNGADKDYADMVFHVSSIEPAPVPEPMTILGSTLALGFGGLFKRQMSKRQKN